MSHLLDGNEDSDADPLHGLETTAVAERSALRRLSQMFLHFEAIISTGQGHSLLLIVVLPVD